MLVLVGPIMAKDDNRQMIRHDLLKLKCNFIGSWDISWKTCLLLFTKSVF